jgi:HEAT repeat protein
MNRLTNWLNYAKMFSRAIKVKMGFASPIVITSFLSNPDAETRWDAADMLYAYYDQALIAPVYEVLQNEPDAHVRKRLIWSLETNKAWDQLYTCLDSPNFDVRTHAADALTRCGETRFVEPLLKRMSENDNQDYMYRMILRGIVDASSLGLLFEYLSNATPAMRRGLLELLGSSKDGQVMNYLLAALKDPDAEIREGAVVGLMLLRDSQAIEPLRGLLDDPSRDVQRMVNAALRVLDQ